MLKLMKALGGDRSGATAIEYGLIAAFIALALTASLPSIRKNLTGVFNSVDTELGQARKAAKN
ncbi:MAG: Flp family type IVb pilin [Polymorphobacter sp.]